jgi:quercetin dioxygenase-like cupin family protein
MITTSEEYTVVLDNDGVIGKRISTEHGCEYVKLELAAGKEIPEHKLDMPVTFFVLHGSGTALLEGKHIEAKTGDLLAVDPGANRGWKNTSKEDLSVLVIKHVG